MEIFHSRPLHSSIVLFDPRIDTIFVLKLDTAVVNEEWPQRYSSQLFSSLVTVDRHVVNPINYTSLADAIQSVNDTKTVAAIYIPKYFSDAIDDRITEGYNADNQSVIDSTISIYIDNSIVMYYNGVMHSLTQTFINVMKSIYAEKNKFFDGIAIDVERTENTKDMKIDNFYMPASYLYYLYMSQILLSSLHLTQERKEGLFERSLIVGVSHELVFISHFLSSVMLAAIQIVFLYITGFLLYDSINNSSLELLFSYLLLGSIYGISLGLMISSFFDKEIVCIIIVWFITIPQLFCSGQYWPLEGLSKAKKWIFYYGSPLAIPIETMRNLVLRGWDLSHDDIKIGYLWTIVPSIIWLSIALMVFKKR